MLETSPDLTGRCRSGQWRLEPAVPPLIARPSVRWRFRRAAARIHLDRLDAEAHPVTVSADGIGDQGDGT